MSRANVDQVALNDPRIKGAARELNWANKFEAIGRMSAVWLACTNLGRTELSAQEIADSMDFEGDPASLVSKLAKLDLIRAEEGDLTRYYVAGSRERCQWLESSKKSPLDRARAGGLARAKTAKRNEKGQLLPAGQVQPKQPAKTSGSSPSVSVSVSGSGSKNKKGSSAPRPPASLELVEISARVLARLSVLSGCEYSPGTKAHTEHLAARIAEGVSESDLISVVENQASEWLGTQMEKYLRPSTLFRPTKFAEYLPQAKKRSLSVEEIHEDDPRSMPPQRYARTDVPG